MLRVARDKPRSWRQPPAAERNKRREEPRHHRYQCRRELTARHCDHRRADHDGHQPGRSQRCQARAHVQEPEEDQAKRAEHLGHADASSERAWQHHWALQRLDR